MKKYKFADIKTNHKITVNPENKEVWDHRTEQLVQQISVRYAHEILNALTPVYGVLQMLKKDANINTSDKHKQLLEIAEQEVLKGKNYVNDFMNININPNPHRQLLKVSELTSYIQNELDRQSPEFSPHVIFHYEENEDECVYVDQKQIRLVLQLIVKKWIDFVDGVAQLKITFDATEPNLFLIHLNMVGDDDFLFESDHEFLFYLHLIARNMKKHGGKMKIGHGVRLEYAYQCDGAKEQLVTQT
ncbi:histidine kinase dimerization/phospho-acceptor domain-containing protein [Evansella cellulosilytica]|uniref:histidine kinase n=1 Tax=Evansella cellulosilytica (strain ATCC 21833 / DSM 2522 / FERM P-1141 / JCM 9156 / N-4) TaxID=649639 RepID=E6TSA7_EVAC2|nr:histidine kinase dimerization/phospho-acceptor domain-containing protein [Evansella cellulosilytica]ADU31876.1 hypothetical protein Bcell_3635 [Evansella cellulosilytica DSM 2522]